MRRNRSDGNSWGIMEQKLSQMKSPNGVQLKFGEINNVLPFPLSEITSVVMPQALYALSPKAV